ncbi:hypothetical protein MMC06_000179 [Schaereria dolodes]|nr:hypothetical protein [Schaereria dolodes]
MDYSYFTAPTQTYPFLGLPPTPTHAYEPQEEQMNGGTDTYQDANSFPAFDPSFRFDASAFIQHPQQQSPPHSQHGQSFPNTLHGESSTGLSNGEYDINDQGQGRSSSEEKEILTPAQSRRKAQNRAAQRAFRERKERRVKDLETKLNSLEAHSSTLLTDNERLKRELQKLYTQNEILLAKSSSHQLPSTYAPPSPIAGPLTYSPTDFQEAVGLDPSAHPLSHRIFRSESTGEKLLASGATWDMIQGHELFRRGMVDVEDVHTRLKGRAVCDGNGPAFKEGDVRKAIEESVLAGGDELI